MTKKKDVLKVSFDWDELETVPTVKEIQPKKINGSLSIDSTLKTVIKQMEVGGYRTRTISDYEKYVKSFARSQSLERLEDIDNASIYRWLDTMGVSPQTKLTRLKCLKAFLTRCFDNGWIKDKYWKSIIIKVPKKIKEGAADNEVKVLLSLLDLSDFVQLRDAVAILLMYKTGIRINTLVQLESRHIDLENCLLKLDGQIMKNYQELVLPFPEKLGKLLTALIAQNKLIRNEYKKENDWIIITRNGDYSAKSTTHNVIQKRLNKYSNEYGLKNINPHALRRGYAKSLLDKGVSIPVISKALGHSDLAVTTKYLNIGMEELVESLRGYL